MREGSLVTPKNNNHAKDAEELERYLGVKPHFPVYGNVYICKEIYKSGEDMCISLEEIPSPMIIAGHELDLLAESFVEVQPPMVISIDEIIQQPETV